MLELPPDLSAALANELAATSPQRLARATAALSARYRDVAPEAPDAGGAFLASDDDIAAYAAYRLPATYAALVAALTELRAQWPAAPPRSLLDVGAGPGTALWAAAEVWPELTQALLLDRDARMLALGQRLAARAAAPLVRDAQWRQADLAGRWDAPAHDLVIAAYVLNELPDAARAALVAALWERARGALLLVEPGTPAGFRRIRDARAQLLAAGAHALAPCPHDAACPMPDNDWCHFAQRVGRSRLQRALKGGTLPYEDEKFAYIAVGQQPAPPIVGRVLRHPRVQPGRVTLQLCAPEGLRVETITRGKARESYRAARDLAWGDALLPDDGEDANMDHR